MELLPTSLRHPIAACTMSTERTLVRGRRTPVSFMTVGGSRWWGEADLTQPQSEQVQSLNQMSQWQFTNAYEAEYARAIGAGVSDATLFMRAVLAASEPMGDFGSGGLAAKLRELAKAMPVYKAQGLKRQVFLVQWGDFDTHVNQRGSEHAWGNHWFALGGPVAGGTVHGTFPTLTLGGPDDGDSGKNGRLVPTTATEQVAATLMRWMGLPADLLPEVFPNLANFSQATIPLLRS